jgi:LPXTG-motif cell wall-anchored protein
MDTVFLDFFHAPTIIVMDSITFVILGGALFMLGLWIAYRKNENKPVAIEKELLEEIPGPTVDQWTDHINDLHVGDHRNTRETTADPKLTVWDKSSV